MADYGRIIAAGTEIDGSELATDHDAGVTVLDLDDALDFLEPEAGETIQVRIIADDDTEELVTIKVPETEDEDTVDEIDGFLYLDAPTVNGYDEGTRVLVHPETKRRIALVRLDDAEEDSETVDAIVDAALYEKIPEGTDLDMAVELFYDGEAYYVTNILGEEPTMEIEAGIFTGGTFRTAESGERIEITAATPDRVRFHNDTGHDVAVIWLDGDSKLHISCAVDIELQAAGQVLVEDSRLTIGTVASQQGNHLRLRNVTDSAQVLPPPSGYVSIFWNSAVGRIQAKNPAGTVRALNEVDF